MGGKVEESRGDTDRVGEREQSCENDNKSASGSEGGAEW